MNQSSWKWTFDQSIHSKLEYARVFVDSTIDQLGVQNWPESEIFGIRLALEEAVVNAMKHGNGLDASKKVRIDCRISPNIFWIEIEDEGSGFNPAAVPDCTAEENLDKPSGRGLLLMNHYMSYVEYNETGNCVVMERRLE